MVVGPAQDQHLLGNYRDIHMVVGGPTPLAPYPCPRYSDKVRPRMEIDIEKLRHLSLADVDNLPPRSLLAYNLEFRLRGPDMTQNILITGASRGIGRAAAILCGKRGWNVGVNYASNKSAAEETVSAVEAAGGKAVALQGDAALEADVIRIFDSMEQTYGSIHSVVVNAGINAPAMKLAEMSLERMKKVFDTNVLGAYLCAREAARRIPKASGDERNRSIVLLSSAAARLGSPNEYVDYAGSKGAIDTLTIGLSKELGPQKIRVNGIRPGIIATDIHASSGDPGRVERLGNAMPLGRPGTAEETGEAIVWLLSEASSYVTGTTIDVAGGR